MSVWQISLRDVQFSKGGAVGLGEKGYGGEVVERRWEMGEEIVVQM